MINRNSNFNAEVPVNQLDLPKLVQDVVKHFDNPLQKKMALASVVTISGALLPKVHFNYENNWHYPSLYTVIVLPPASGKGSTGKIELILKKIIEDQLRDIKILKSKYAREVRDYNRATREGQDVNPPVKPAYPLLKIPGNITSSKFIEQLDENSGQMFALIFESEIDGITNMMTNGQYGKDNSMILRKAYHNESVSIMRKGGDHFDIRSPKLSIVLTGTPSQLSGLFKSIEDGLFSRFLIVKGDVPLVWKDVQPCDTCVPIEVKLDMLSHDFHSYYSKMKDLNIEFKMNDQQWNQINEFGKTRLNDSFQQGGDYATSVAKRHAVMIARTACILSMLRYFEENCQDDVWICQDRDFVAALSIVLESYKCSIDIFNSLKKQKDKEGDSKIDEFFERIPKSFRTNELAPLLKSMKISERSKYRYLDDLVQMGKLISPSKGVYAKNVVAVVADGSNSSQNPPLEK